MNIDGRTMHAKGWIAVAACALAIVWTVPHRCGAAEPAKKPAAWAVGKRFEQALGQKTDLELANAPLGAALARLSANHHVAIVLDRRVDPDRLLTLSVSGQPLAEVLGEIAQSAGLGVSLAEPIVYLGPPAEAAALRTLVHLRRQEVAALPAARRTALSAAKAWGWDDLATPRDLAESLAGEAHVKIAGLERIPHDLWAGRRLPPMAWTDRLTLLAIEFGLAYEIEADGRTVRLVKIPARVVARRSFAGG
ncbi:MAG TPA: hypothetical protein VMF30_08065, partial [Pirellulales bacterium]|nr:hypothetical protein [Pirellulales bacterium]